jgi:hypothetical protein
MSKRQIYIAAGLEIKAKVAASEMNLREQAANAEILKNQATVVIAELGKRLLEMSGGDVDRVNSIMRPFLDGIGEN